jgi:hypothetical protein
MSDDVKNLLVIVQSGANISDDDCDEYEVKLQSSVEGCHDVELLKQLLIKKSSYLESTIKAGLVTFKQESETKPGKWVTIGEHSPIKDQSMVRCCVLKPKSLMSSLSNEGKLCLTHDIVTVSLICIFYMLYTGWEGYRSDKVPGISGGEPTQRSQSSLSNCTSSFLSGTFSSRNPYNDIGMT